MVSLWLIDADVTKPGLSTSSSSALGFQTVLPTSMSSTLPEHGNNQDSPTDDSILNSFNLFLSLMTPLEFTKLLQSRVKHLLQTWPSPSSTAKESYHKTHSSDHEPLALSMESIRSLTSFFRMQDTPTSPESSTLSSQSNIHQHLVALETLLSCLSPKELQRLIQSRLKEGGRERTAAIRGLLDVMRSAANDETPENQTRSGSSVLRINLRSDSEDNGTPSTNTCPVNLSPGTAPIPRVMSPGTRDQSADDSINTPQGDPPKSHPSPQTIMEQVACTPLFFRVEMFMLTICSYRLVEFIKSTEHSVPFAYRLDFKDFLTHRHKSV